MQPALVGLYGGSFDPVHRGHVATAEELREHFAFKEIRFLPAAQSPLKAHSTAKRHRLAMLELALSGKQGLTLDTRELQNPPPSYTVDTLQALRAELGPAQPLAFIMGMDSLLELPRWRRWQELTDLAHIVVISRPGHEPVFPDALAGWLKTVQATDASLLQSRPFGLLHLTATRQWPIASRDIRALVARGGNASPFLDPRVWDYIQANGLYLEHSTPDERA